MNPSAKQEKSFAIMLAAPSVLVLIITTTFPILYLIWSSFQNINLALVFLRFPLDLPDT